MSEITQQEKNGILQIGAGVLSIYRTDTVREVETLFAIQVFFQKTSTSFTKYTGSVVVFKKADTQEQENQADFQYPLPVSPRYKYRFDHLYTPGDENIISKQLAKSRALSIFSVLGIDSYDNYLEIEEKISPYA